MTSPFLESSWKIKLGSKGQAVSSVSGFWVIVFNLGEGPNYSSNSEDCLLLLIIIIIIIIFLRIFRGPNSPTVWHLSPRKFTGMLVLLPLGLLWLFVTLDMIESELFPKNKILQKNTTLRQYLLFFKSFIFILFTCPRQSPWSTSFTTYQSPFSN